MSMANKNINIQITYSWSNMEDISWNLFPEICQYCTATWGALALPDSMLKILIV